MNKKNLTSVMVVVSLVFSYLTQLVCAQGVIYESKNLDQNKIRITLKNSEADSNKGVRIKYFYLTNAKLLTIGYELKAGLKNETYLDFDLNTAIPPLRVNLVNADDESKLPFNDIKSSEELEYIWHLHDMGIVNGRVDGSFDPKGKISRAEFIVIMVKALNLETINYNKTIEYTDIEKHWAREAITTALENKLIYGYQDKTIKPDNNVTIAEACSIINKSFKFKTVKNGIYGNLKQDKWYSNAVKNIFDTGIINIEDKIYKTFDEGSFISREDCAMLVSRALSTY